jgi:predicted dinucleotide-binding enzyme
MAAVPRISIVGAGNLGTALAVSLRRAGYTIESVMARSGGAVTPIT